jgi:hypothetical protein
MHPPSLRYPLWHDEAQWVELHEEKQPHEKPNVGPNRVLVRGEDAHCLIESVKIRVCNAEVGLFRKTLKGPDRWRDLREDGYLI